MKLKTTIFMAAIILISPFSSAFGRDRAVNGLIIGGGSGALVGQAIGRNTESTVIGATVGGILGYIIGNETRHSHHINYDHVTPHSNNRYRYTHGPIIVKEKHYNSPRHRHETCKETITYTRTHGHTERIVSTQCWDTGKSAYRSRPPSSHRNNSYGFRNRGHGKKHYRFRH